TMFAAATPLAARAAHITGSHAIVISPPTCLAIHLAARLRAAAGPRAAGDPLLPLNCRASGVRVRRCLLLTRPAVAPMARTTASRHASASRWPGERPCLLAQSRTVVASTAAHEGCALAAGPGAARFGVARLGAAGLGAAGPAAGLG